MYFSKRTAGAKILTLCVLATTLLLLEFTGRATAACSLSSDKGQDSAAVTIDTTGAYTLWVRMLSPSAKSNSVSVQIDRQCPIVVGDVQSGGGFSWVNYKSDKTPIRLNLSSGVHSISLAGREAGTGVDKVMVVADQSCVPQGAGGNCLGGAAASATPTTDNSKSQQEPSKNTAIVKYGWLTGAALVATIATGGLLLWGHHFRKPTSILHNPFAEVYVGGGKLPRLRLSPKALHILRRPKLVIGIYALLMALALAVAFAAATSGQKEFEAEVGKLSGGAKVVSSTSASGGKYVVFNANLSKSGSTTAGGSTSTSGGQTSTKNSSSTSSGSSSSSSCALPKYPTPSCTGVPTGTKLTVINGDYNATTNGEIINAKHITGNLIILANNVTITNSEIDGTIYNDQGSLHGSFTVTDTTIGPASGCVGQPAINDSNYVARRVRSRGHDDGFRVGPPGNVKVYDSYEENCYLPPSQAPPDGSHSDGVQAVCAGTACSGVIIDHNTFEGRNVPTTNMLNLTDPQLSDVTATNNLMGGGAYVIDAWWHSGPTWIIQNNRVINNSWAYGAVTAENTCAHQSWSGNKLVTVDSSYNITATIGAQGCVE